MAASSLVKEIAKVAEKDEAIQKSFIKMTFVIAGGITTLVIAYKVIKTKCEILSIKKTAEEDAENYTAKCMADVMKYRANAETDYIYGRNRKSEEMGVDEENDTYTVKIPWNEYFTHPMPELPPFLEKIMHIVPDGYEQAMLLHLLSMLGALCFSKIRAKYLDNDIHAPNIQVIVEGAWGSGKAKFEKLYKLGTHFE